MLVAPFQSPLPAQSHLSDLLMRPFILLLFREGLRSCQDFFWGPALPTLGCGPDTLWWPWEAQALRLHSSQQKRERGKTRPSFEETFRSCTYPFHFYWPECSHTTSGSTQGPVDLNELQLLLASSCGIQTFQDLASAYLHNIPSLGCFINTPKLTLPLEALLQKQLMLGTSLAV